MTYGEVMTQVVREITGMSSEEAEFIIAQFRLTHPEAHRFDSELPPDEAEKMFHDLMAQVPTVLNWLTDVVRKENQNLGNA